MGCEFFLKISGGPQNLFIFIFPFRKFRSSINSFKNLRLTVCCKAPHGSVYNINQHLQLDITSWGQSF